MLYMTKYITLNKTLKARNLQTIQYNQYKVFIIPTNSDIISVQSYIFSGFINETKQNLGISHLLEHVLANAYKHCKQFDCYTYLLNNGLVSNAFTSNNVLKYYVSGDKNKLDEMIDYIISITTNPTFDNKLIEREKKAIINELLMYIDDSKTNLLLESDKAFFKQFGLKYKRDYHLQINNLKHFNANVLSTYYKKTYGPNNTIFIVSGNINKELIKQIFMDRLPKNNMIKHLDIKPCFNYKNKFIFIQNTKLKSTQINIRYPTTVQFNDKKVIKLQLLVYILQNYLFINLRVKEKLVYGVHINIHSDVCGVYVQIFINTSNNSVKEVLLKLEHYIKNLKKIEKLTAQVKQIYKNKYKSTYYSSQKIADLLGIQAIYRHMLNTKIFYPEDFKDIYLNTNTKELIKLYNKWIKNNDKMVFVSNKNTDL